LKNVVLSGIEVRRCTQCDNYDVSIPRMEQLHRLIALAIIEKESRLRGEEVRYLRSLLGWSGASLARHMGVADETVSRWENDATPIGPQADRLLRLIVARDKLVRKYSMHRLARIDAKKATTLRMDFGTSQNQWMLLTA
jgi:putative zinc finger/helix-turn-helix YgiT family protein